LGTVADVVPLKGENRVLVKIGLKGFRNGRDPVFRAICRVAGLEPEEMTARHLAFMIAPRLNAVGRLGEVEVGRNLLSAHDRKEIDRLALVVDRLNSSRRALEREVFDQADRMIADQPEKYLRAAVVIEGEGWSRGVVGIVAARLCEKYCRPAVVISLEGEDGTGSGRSVPGFDLFSALAECSDCLVKFGGHKQAAGISLKRDRVEDFRQALDRLAERELGPSGAIPQLEIDAELGLEEADCRLAGELETLEPCGQGNPPPVFFTTGLEILGEPKVIGRGSQHLKIRLAKNGVARDFLGWGMALRAVALPAGKLDAAYQVKKGSWRGEEQVELILKDFRDSAGAGCGL